MSAGDYRFDVVTHYDRLPKIGWPAYDNLIRRGVPSSALAYDIPARAEVLFFPDRPLFDFAADIGDEGAVAALMFLALDQLGEPIDLVAWSPKPHRLAAWYGAALLGSEQIWGPRLANEGALAVYEDPFDWLRADRRGVVIIDPTTAAPLLHEAGHLVAPSVDAGKRLLCLVTPPTPRISVLLAASLESA